jgi:hypothetical protein
LQKLQKRVVVVAKGSRRHPEQQMAAYVPVQSAYASTKQSRSFGPFNIKF